MLGCVFLIRSTRMCIGICNMWGCVFLIRSTMMCIGTGNIYVRMCISNKKHQDVYRYMQYVRMCISHKKHHVDRQCVRVCADQEDVSFSVECWKEGCVIVITNYLYTPNPHMCWNHTDGRSSRRHGWVHAPPPPPLPVHQPHWHIPVIVIRRTVDVYISGR